MLALNVANADNEVINLGALYDGYTTSDNGNVSTNDTDHILFSLTDTLNLSGSGNFFSFSSQDTSLNVLFEGSSISSRSFDVVNGQSGYFGPESLLAGDYSFTLSNKVTSDTYEYSISAVSEAPEPATLALMLSGLGLVGFMARCRKAA